MKILHISAYDNLGGGGRAAYRLHKSLLENGVDSKMLVLNKTIDEAQIIGLLNSPLSRIYDLIVQIINYLPIKKYKREKYIGWSTNRVSSGRTLKWINSLNPDIIHLHWIGNSMLSIKEIKKIKQPLIWTFHDSWAFTGGCHVPFPCTKYTQDCGKCPQLNSLKHKDPSLRTLSIKTKHWKSTTIKITTPSQWMTECVKNSSIFSQSSPITIPNGIDIDNFKPIDKIIARQILNISSEKKIILFGAIGATEDKNKGFNLLISALNKLIKIDNSFQLLVFGSSKPLFHTEYSFSVNFLGRINDDITLSLLYSCADVMIVPSMTESFGQTALESMACGTPVVAFNTTGIKDIINHKVNGYLANPYDPNDLASGILWILSNTDNYQTLSYNARKKVIETFNIKIVDQKFISLYKSIIIN